MFKFMIIIIILYEHSGKNNCKSLKIYFILNILIITLMTI